jgi:DnaJ like chaperone protein
MTGWMGKLIGGFIGALAMGPLGAALGALVGHQYDRGAGAQPFSTASPAEIAEHFFRITFRVMGYIAKSDGRVSESEIAAARSIMSQLRLDPLRVRAAIDCFNAGKSGQFDLTEDLATLLRMCAGRPDLLRIFLELQGPVRSLLAQVAGKLGISAMELAHIEAVLRIRSGSFSHGAARRGPAPIDQAYEVLEVSASAADEEVIKAYRRQLSRHHPDKLKANGLPESMLEHAKERTQQIIEAYEVIKERRGL